MHIIFESFLKCSHCHSWSFSWIVIFRLFKNTSQWPWKNFAPSFHFLMTSLSLASDWPTITLWFRARSSRCSVMSCTRQRRRLLVHRNSRDRTSRRAKNLSTLPCVQPPLRTEGASLSAGCQFRSIPSDRPYSASDLPFSSAGWERCELLRTDKGLPEGDRLEMRPQYTFHRSPSLKRHSLVVLNFKEGAESGRKSAKLRRLLRSLGPIGRAEVEVERNWILKEELEEGQRHLRQRIAKLSVSLPADDGTKLIEDRLAEVRAMCNHSIHTDFFLSTLHSAVRDAVLVSCSLAHVKD